jgi:mono/diheme cytochrome c family protein
VIGARAALLLALAAAGCTERMPEERGEALFSDPGLSPSASNEVACVTCHTAGPETPEVILAGGTLMNVLGRPHYWGGAIPDAREAINFCLRSFMRDPRPAPLAVDDPQGLDLLAYLETLGTAPSPPVPFTVPRSVPTMLPEGDPARGAAIYESACRTCHGSVNDGLGGLTAAPVIPTETLMEHPENEAGAVIVARIRHGGFFGIGGEEMPPFSVERITDQDIADILALFELQLRP